MAVPGKPHIVMVCGGSGSGKTAWLSRQVKKEKRVIVWDMKGEYARDFGYELVATLPALIERVRGAREARIAFSSVNPKDFDAWARVAYAWGRCVVIAEELADVTTPGKAPLGWGMVVRRGRDRALKVYGVTQRPSESDKTIVGNRTLIHCCMLPRAADRAYMAREMGVDQSVLDALQPLQYVEADQQNRITRRNLTF